MYSMFEVLPELLLCCFAIGKSQFFIFGKNRTPIIFSLDECVKMAWDSQVGLSIVPNHN